MGKRFRTDHLDQTLLMPPSLHDWLAEGHLARFIGDVTEELDLGSIHRSYQGDGRGKAAYPPMMMLRVLLYGYCRGVASSRKIEQATYDDVAFRFLSADMHPDHDTIAAFRKRHPTPSAFPVSAPGRYQKVAEIQSGRVCESSSRFHFPGRTRWVQGKHPSSVLPNCPVTSPMAPPNNLALRDLNWRPRLSND